jgi:hypothetical protein
MPGTPYMMELDFTNKKTYVLDGKYNMHFRPPLVSDGGDEDSRQWLAARWVTAATTTCYCSCCCVVCMSEVKHDHDDCWTGGSGGLTPVTTVTPSRQDGSYTPANGWRQTGDGGGGDY